MARARNSVKAQRVDYKTFDNSTFGFKGIFLLFK